MKHDVIVPSTGESVTEAYIGNWLKKSGDFVKKGDVLVELETQKATFEIESEYSGRLEVLFPQTGDKVGVGVAVARIDTDAQGSAASEEKSASPVQAQKNEPAKTQPSFTPPLAKQEFSGTPAQRRHAMENGGQQPVVVTAATVSNAPVTMSVEPPYVYPFDESRGDRREKASRIRQQIAKNLVKAQHTAAILTTFNEIDMTSVLEFRAKYKDQFKQKNGVSLGMVGLFALASARALKMYPLVNSIFTGEEIIRRDYVDISVAVSTDRGLVVPVIRDIDRMTLVDFEKALAQLSEKARLGKLSIPEMTGGTFTISNGGVFGSLLSTPILNMPQSAILGLHKIEKRAVVKDDQIQIRSMMSVALSYDHRIIDGKDAVQFLVAIKEAVENVSLIVKDPI